MSKISIRKLIEDTVNETIVKLKKSRIDERKSKINI